MPGSGLRTEVLERAPGKNASGDPNTKEGIEAVVSVPSLLRAHSPSTQCRGYSSDDE